MRGIIVGPCGSEDPNKGHRFTIQAKSGGTFLTRNGEVVARAEGLVLSQAAIHFDWTSVAVRKEGNKLSLKYWGRTVLEYEHSAPLEGGCVSLGTYNNATSFQRVAIHEAGVIGGGPGLAADRPARRGRRGGPLAGRPLHPPQDS